MPYIAPERREALDNYISDVQAALARLGCTEGDLNYVVSRLVGFYFRAEPRYHTIARIRGVLGNVADEFYRRIAGPYEDKAIAKNGDVPEYAPPRELKPLAFPAHPVYPGQPARFEQPSGKVEISEGVSVRAVELASLEHSTQRVVGHLREKCAGRPCTLHNRSAHHLRHMRQLWRDDAQLMERVCEHGVGHPDPDDLKAADYRHGCDGCCRP